MKVFTRQAAVTAIPAYRTYGTFAGLSKGQREPATWHPKAPRTASVQIGITRNFKTVLAALSLWIGGPALIQVQAGEPGTGVLKPVVQTAAPLETLQSPPASPRKSSPGWKAFQRLATEIREDLAATDTHVQRLAKGLKQTDAQRTKFLAALKQENREEAQKLLGQLSQIEKDAGRNLEWEAQTAMKATTCLRKARELTEKMSGAEGEMARTMWEEELVPNVRRLSEKTDQAVVSNVLNRCTFEAAQVLFEMTGQSTAPLPLDWKKELEALQTRLEAHIAVELGKTNMALGNLAKSVTEVQKLQDAQGKALTDLQARLAVLENNPLPPNVQKELDKINRLLANYEKRLNAGDTQNEVQDKTLAEVLIRLEKLEKNSSDTLRKELQAVKDLVIQVQQNLAEFQKTVGNHANLLEALKETDNAHDKFLSELQVRVKKLEETGPTPPDLAKKLEALQNKMEARIQEVAKDMQQSVDALKARDAEFSKQLTNQSATLTELSKKLDELAKNPVPPNLEETLQSMRQAINVLQASDASQTSQLKSVTAKNNVQDTTLSDLAKRLGIVERDQLTPEGLQREVTRIVREQTQDLRKEIEKVMETRLSEQKAEFTETIQQLVIQLDNDGERLNRLEGLVSRLDERIADAEKRLAELEKGGSNSPGDISFAEAELSFNNYYRAVCAAEERFASVVSYYNLRNFYLTMRNPARAQEMAAKLGASARAYREVVPTLLKEEQSKAKNALDTAMQEAGNQKARVQILLDQMPDLDALTTSHLTQGLQRVNRYAGQGASISIQTQPSSESLNDLVRSTVRHGVKVTQVPQFPRKDQVLDVSWVTQKLKAEKVSPETLNQLVRWMQGNGLDSYGNQAGTLYADDTPLFIRNSGGKYLMLKEYLSIRYPHKPWLSY